MKLLKMSLLLLIIGANFQTAEAQFFKKLKEKVAKFAENSGGPNNYYATFLDENTTGRFTIDLDTTWRATVRGANYDEYDYSNSKSKKAKVPIFSYTHAQVYLIKTSDKNLVRVKYGKDRRIEKNALSIEKEEFLWFFKNKADAQAFMASKTKQDSAFQGLKKITDIFKNERDNEIAAKKAADERKKAQLDSSRAADRKKYRENMLANNRLPKRGFRDSKLEKDLITSAQVRGIIHKGDKAVGAYFVSDDWDAIRNEYTGVIVGRQITGVILIKKANGDCEALLGNFRQKYNGTSYTSMWMDSVSQMGGLIDCKYFK